MIIAIDSKLVHNAQRLAGKDVHRVNNIIQAYIYNVFNYNRQKDYIIKEKIKDNIDGIEKRMRRFCAGDSKVLHEEVVYF